VSQNRRSIVFLLMAVCGLCGAAFPASAHEIPADVVIRAFVKPEENRLRLLVRVPLEAMRDMQFPLQGPGYIDLAAADTELRNAALLWIGNEVVLYENGIRLEKPTVVAALVSKPTDRSFESYEEAFALVTGPRLPDETQLYWQQALLDALLEYPIRSERSEFSIDRALEGLGLRVVTSLRFLPPDGSVRAYEYTGNPGRIVLDPGWSQAAVRFVKAGFYHILGGPDHLLFLLCLVIPFLRFGPLVAIVTAFTLAHSITLFVSAFGFAPDALWFPPLVETLIAVSILYMALENIVSATPKRRWGIAFCFGLIHGFGFSIALRETLQFGGDHLLTSLLTFNVGVEIGQIAALCVFVPTLSLLYRFVVKERLGVIMLSAFVAHTGWHWMTERGATLLQYEFRLPVLDLSFVSAALGWAVVILAAAGAIRYGAGWMRRIRPGRDR